MARVGRGRAMHCAMARAKPQARTHPSDSVWLVGQKMECAEVRRLAGA